jgi:putative molybdopterin biosynthesis protein
MATAHLWDGDSGQYNVPFVRRMLPGIPAVIIHLACRLQGFYVPKNNPKGIKGWEDLGRKDITIINREKGSGTRILLDEHLRRLGIPSKNIKGYNRESTSHLAIASTVARGGADIGIGNEKSGLQVQGIDFIPLQTERYEMVIKKEDIDKAPFQTVLEILRSQEFKMELEGIGGYDLIELGQIVAET